MSAWRSGIVMAAIVAGIVLAACGGSATGAGDAYGEKSAVTMPGPAVTVELKGLQFVPKGIKIKPGTTVTWVNDDPVIHNVSQIQSVFLSPVLKQGEKFSYTFTKPGTYRYQCTFHHPYMNGVVIVESK